MALSQPPLWPGIKGAMSPGPTVQTGGRTGRTFPFPAAVVVVDEYIYTESTDLVEPSSISGTARGGILGRLPGRVI